MKINNVFKVCLKWLKYDSAHTFTFIPGSKQDNLIPLLSRKCRAFALNNSNGNSKENDTLEDIDDENETPTLLNNSKPEQMVDDDEDDSPKPDLSQIIRSLDTPPPSS